MTLKKNTYTAITIDTLLPFGSGQGMVQGMPVIVPHTVPGDKADIKVIKVEKRRAIGKLLSLKTRSPDRCEPRCLVATTCGGCQLQHVTYDTQLSHKQTLLESALGVPISMRASVSPFHYRNKLQMTFGRDAKGTPTLGLYATHTNVVVDTSECHIVHSDIQSVFTAVRTWMKSQETLPNHLVIRHSRNSRDVMLIFVLLDSQHTLIETITSTFATDPHVTSLWICKNSDPGSSVLTEDLIHLHGTKTLSDSLLDIHFELSPTSFMQNNPDMTEQLYTHVNHILSTLSVKYVWDLYCGIGIMTQVCSSVVDKIVGVELNANAIENAMQSCVKNAISNCEFICNDATEYVVESLETDLPEAVILDPPRKGCSPALLNALGAKKIAHIIYVSCSPQSLGRDVKILCNMGYSIESSVGFDCFANTVHVEAVVHLRYTD